MPEPIDVQGHTFLQRFTVRPGHLDAWWPIFEREVELRRRHGFTTLRAFVETDAEPKVSWLYSHPDPMKGEARMALDPDKNEIIRERAPHVFLNKLTRPVDIEAMTVASPGEAVALGGAPDRTAIMRRYTVVGDWDQFLAVWRTIVPLREKHGFRLLFAVVDKEKDMFTWAFDVDGTWEQLPDLQRPYFQDPERKALRGVMDYMADYSIHPAQPLL